MGLIIRWEQESNEYVSQLRKGHLALCIDLIVVFDCFYFTQPCLLLVFFFTY